mgnify:FL=1
MEEKIIAVKSQGRLRKIFTIRENKEGVYFFIKSGTQEGLPPNNKIVSYEKYSIHHSRKSATYNTVKLTTKFKSGEERTVSALTNAVKTRTGFSPVFVIRFSDLNAPIYDLKEGDKEKVILEINDFDPTENTLYFGIYIGRADTPFPAFEGVTVSQRCYENIRVVLVYAYNMIPAIPYSYVYCRATFKPSDTNDTSSISKMNGESVERNIEHFRMSFNLLLKNQLMTLLSKLLESGANETDESIKNLRLALEQIPQPPIIAF